MAQDILKQTGRVTRIVESLMNFSHTGTEPAESHAGADQPRGLHGRGHSPAGTGSRAKPAHFDNRCDRELLVLADSQRLLQVFVNLLG